MLIDVFVKHYPFLCAVVVADYRAGTLAINQPQYLGGRIETTLDTYNDFEGTMQDFILHLRAKKGK